MAEGRTERTRPAGQAAERGSSFLRAPAQARRGQALLEYAVFIAVVIAALTAMQVYAKRSIQAGIKTAADGLSPFGAADPDGRKAQLEGMRYETGERRNRAVAAAGTVLDRHSKVTATTTRAVDDGETAGGGRQRTTIRDTTTTEGALELEDGVFSSRSEVVVEIR